MSWLSGSRASVAAKTQTTATSQSSFAINLEPEYGGRGLGRRLLLEVVDDLRQFGDQAVLWVVPANARARSLYELTGWLDDGGRRQDEEGGAAVDEIGIGHTLQV